MTFEPRSAEAEEWRSRSHPVAERMEFQRRGWRAQRFSWLLLLAFVLAAPFGLFSNGPLSWTESRSADGALTVEHQRFYRNGALSTFTVRLPADPASGEQTLLIGREIVGVLTFETIHPQPDSTKTSAEGIRLTFATEGSGSGAVTFTVRPRHAGTISDTIALAGGSSAVEVRFFVYP